MDVTVFEIIPTIKISDNIFKYNDNFKFDNILKNFKKLDISPQEVKIYVYQDLQLIVDNNNSASNSNLSCFRVENIDSTVCDKIIYTKQNFKNIPIDHFPFISNYDNIINRKIYEYGNGISFIEERKFINNSTDSKEIVSFIEVINDGELENIIKMFN